MTSNTQTIAIAAPRAAVFAIVADPESLPRWAIGFARAIERSGDGRWVVELAGGGRVPIRFAADAELGVVDFHMEPAAGVTAVAHARVLDNGDGSEVVFTQFQGDQPDEVFAAQIDAVTHELVVLKALAETECPL